MLLFNFEVSLILTWSANCFIPCNAAANQTRTFVITNTKINVPVVTLSIQDKVELLQQLKSGFKHVTTCNKYSHGPFLVISRNLLMQTSSSTY